MGMFDNLTIKNRVLPRKEGEKTDLESLMYQTKDFECFLWMVTIDDDKVYISKEEYHFEETPSTIFGLAMVVDKKYSVDCIEYGNMFFRFYSSDPVTNEWIEFEAEYKDGLIRGIERIA